MQSSSTRYSSDDPDRRVPVASMLSNASYSTIRDSVPEAIEPVQFSSRFVDRMEMAAPIETVTDYLDAHPDWFRRCAQPMKAEPLGKDGYALAIGQFGSFGYQVEPKIGLHLLPQEGGVYRIETIPIPGYEQAGYEVDFRAVMKLVESADPPADPTEADPASHKITCVQWQLDLTVTIQFPRFVHKLPRPLIQSTGDRLLHQIVRQVSGRLTHKVLNDFHTTYGLSIPKRSQSRSQG